MKSTLQLASAASARLARFLDALGVAADKLPFQPVTLIHNISVPNVPAG